MEIPAEYLWILSKHEKKSLLKECERRARALE
jgi:hypothetical protein